MYEESDEVTITPYVRKSHPDRPVAGAPADMPLPADLEITVLRNAQTRAAERLERENLPVGDRYEAEANEILPAIVLDNPEYKQ